jgi:hypothetical protein
LSYGIIFAFPNTIVKEKTTKIATQLIPFFLTMVLLPSCSVGTVKPFLKDHEFQAQNLPVRTLRILLLTDGSDNKSKIINLIDRCSQLIEGQVGIRLEIVAWKNIDWNDTDWKSKLLTVRMLKKIANRTRSDRGRFDIAIAFTSLTLFGDGVLGLFGGTWLGVIDDTYRRYIIVKLLDPYVLMHELFHAFIFSEAHSMTCIMSTGFYPIGKNCLWLGMKDRMEVLRNKQRDFSIKPNAKGGTDFIEEPKDTVNIRDTLVENGQK